MGSGKHKHVQVHLYSEKILNAQRDTIKPAYPQTPGHTVTQIEYLCWTKTCNSAGKAPRWTDMKMTLRITLLSVVWQHCRSGGGTGLVTTDSQEGWIYSSIPLCTGRTNWVCACMLSTKESHVKQQMSNGVARNQLLNSNPSCTVNAPGGPGQVYQHVSELL